MYLEDIESEEALQHLKEFEKTKANHIPYHHSVFLHYKLGPDAIKYDERGIYLVQNRKLGIVPKGTVKMLKQNIKNIKNDRKHHAYYLYTDLINNKTWISTGYMTIQDFVNIAEDKM